MALKGWAVAGLALGLLAPNCSIKRGLAVGVGNGVGDVRASGKRKPTNGVVLDAGGIGRAAKVPAVVPVDVQFVVCRGDGEGANVAVEFRVTAWPVALE